MVYRVVINCFRFDQTVSSLYQLRPVIIAWLSVHYWEAYRRQSRTSRKYTSLVHFKLNWEEIKTEQYETGIHKLSKCKINWFFKDLKTVLQHVFCWIIWYQKHNMSLFLSDPLSDHGQSLPANFLLIIFFVWLYMLERQYTHYVMQLIGDANIQINIK